jgi:hypothetical protein
MACGVFFSPGRCSAFQLDLDLMTQGSTLRVSWGYAVKTQLYPPNREEMQRWCIGQFGRNGWAVFPKFGNTEEECYLEWRFWNECDATMFGLAWEENLL